jgi:hypothetical protein
VESKWDSHGTALYGNGIVENGNQQTRLLTNKVPTPLDRLVKEVVLRSKTNDMDFFAELFS